jgi:hypothetical protein
MRTKLVVAAVFVIAAVALADVVRGPGRERPAEPEAAGAGPVRVALERGEAGRFSIDGGYLGERVLRDGEDYLGHRQIADAFPGLTGSDSIFDVRDVALAPNGTLVLAVIHFPATRPATAALELWRGRELVGAFGVLPGSLSGGLGFTAEGRLLIAAFSADGRRATLYDWAGRFVRRVSLV